MLFRLLVLVEKRLLVKKSWLWHKNLEIEKEIPQHDKYMTATVFNKLMKDNFVKRSKQAYLASKKDSPDFIKKTDVDEKLIKLKKKKYLK